MEGYSKSFKPMSIASRLGVGHHRSGFKTSAWVLITLAIIGGGFKLLTKYLGQERAAGPSVSVHAENYAAPGPNPARVPDALPATNAVGGIQIQGANSGDIQVAGRDINPNPVEVLKQDSENRRKEEEIRLKQEAERRQQERAEQEKLRKQAVNRARFAREIVPSLVIALARRSEVYGYSSVGGTILRLDFLPGDSAGTLTIRGHWRGKWGGPMREALIQAYLFEKPDGKIALDPDHAPDYSDFNDALKDAWQQREMAGEIVMLFDAMSKDNQARRPQASPSPQPKVRRSPPESTRGSVAPFDTTPRVPINLLQRVLVSEG